MNAFSNFDRRSLLRWGAALSLLVAAPRFGNAGGNDTIGSLPSADGGDGSQTMYVVGPRDRVLNAIDDAYGDGFYVAVQLPDNQVWLEFYGDVTIVLDAAFLAWNPDIGLGIGAGIAGGGMAVAPEVNGVLTGRVLRLPVGGTLATPYARISELASVGLALHTSQKYDGHRAVITYAELGGQLKLTQQHQ